MARLVLLLLLALSLWPSSAAAGMRAPVQDAPDRIHGVDSAYGEGALRSAGGFQLFRAVESCGPGGCTHRSGHGPSSAPQPLSGCGALAPYLRPQVRERAQDVDRAVAPICERLPYFATAPPSSR